MLKVEMDSDVLEVGIMIGAVMEVEAFETDAQAECEGFYWHDEINRWINVNELNEYYEIVNA